MTRNPTDPIINNNRINNLTVENQLDLIMHTLSTMNISIASINGAIEMIKFRLDNLEIKNDSLSRNNIQKTAKVLKKRKNKRSS